jgi:uncharacterized protein
MSTKTKGIIAYILISFGMAWILWEIVFRLGISTGSPYFQLASLPSGFAPAIAAIIVRKWITREGFGDAGLWPRFRKSWRYYLIALFLPVVVMAIIILLAAVTGLGQPDFTLMRALKTLAPNGDLNGLPPYLPFVVISELPFTAILATPLLWGEEFGWRGYLQIRLLAERPVLAAVATGIIWGIWHYPVNLRGYNYPEHPILGLLVFPIGTVLLSIIFGWLFLKSGSIWVNSLAHAATNAIGGSLTFLLFTGGGDFLYVSYLGILGWVPLGAIALWIILTGRLKPKSEMLAESKNE